MRLGSELGYEPENHCDPWPRGKWFGLGIVSKEDLKMMKQAMVWLTEVSVAP